jgi:hypothetical protein
VIDSVRIQQAGKRARRLYLSKRFRNAYVAGARAALGEKPRSACPYPSSGGTWKDTDRAAWLHGWHSEATSDE